jgi:hypothetical protein
MKTFRPILATRGSLLVAAMCMFLLAGCATQKVDWAGRVGHYTYDQAILEIGPPDKQAKLEDGTVVADWLTRRGYVYSSPAFGYAPWAYYGPYYPGYVDTYTPDYFLRLTFGPDGKLGSWRKFAR